MTEYRSVITFYGTTSRLLTENPAGDDYCYTCAYQTAWLEADEVVKYEKLLYEATNTESGLNITSGRNINS